MKLTPRDNIPKEVCFLLAVVGPALLPALETKESMTSYNPQQIMRQFGFHQGDVMMAGNKSLSSIKNSEAKLINQGRDKILSSFETFF